MSSITEDIGIEEIREMLKENKTFNQIMIDIMKIGKKIVDRVGHKEYSSFEEVLEEIKNHSSPLFYIDKEVITNFENVGANIIGVKNCPFKKLMQQMSSSGTSDAKVDTVMNGFQIGENMEGKFLDIGCYVAQQLRQMIVSSFKVKGEYSVNYIHLGCDRKTGKKVITDEVKAINIDPDLLDRLLKEVDCVYALSFKEARED